MHNTTAISKRWKHFLAAGGALAAFPATTQAGVIYSGLINDSSVATATKSYDIDLNLTNDITFGLSPSAILVTAFNVFNFKASGANVPDYLAFGTTIDASLSYLGGPSNMLEYFGSWKKPWSGFRGVEGYMGFRRAVGPDYNYGWMRLTVDGIGAGEGTSLTVHDWAYEDLLNTSITAGNTGAAAVPEPSTFALLAAGAAGLALLRRRRSA